MAKKLRRKTTAYRLRTKVGLIGKLMLFIKLASRPFFQGQFLFKFAKFGVFRTYIGFSNCEYGCSLNKSSLCRYQRWTEWSRRFGQAQWLTSKRCRFILAYSSQQKFGRTFGIRLHKLCYKIISEWERHICLSKLETVLDSFWWVCMVHLWTNCVVHVIW